MNTEKFCQSCGTRLTADVPGGLCPACMMKVAMETGSQGGEGTERHSFNPPRVEELAGRFPGLEILEFIGRGGMGAVYKARQKELDRIVALKILPPDVGRDPAFAERFAREAKALARLNHPGIVTIYDFGRSDGLFFFIMEYVDGVTLRQLLQKERIAPREALAIVPQICDALQYAHDQGIVHRDIKPENILLDRRGRVKVADFGLAKLVGDAAESATGEAPAESPALTGAGKVMGTPSYMAPEQFTRPLEVDHRADIYSLGVVFYQMLTGTLPDKPLEPPSKRVHVDVRLDEVVLRALEQKPERRYQQASVLKTQVETLAGETAGAGSRSAGEGVPTAAATGPQWDWQRYTLTPQSVRSQFTWLTYTWFGGWVISMVAEFVEVLWILAFPALVLTTVFWCILLYRHWALLQGHGARTTPGKAVGFGFIPVFCFYWWFVSYAGLATDNNRYLRQLGINHVRMSYGLAVTNCILSVLMVTVGLIPYYGVIVTLPYMVLGFISARQQKECILAMLELSASVRKQSEEGKAAAVASAPRTGTGRVLLTVAGAILLAGLLVVGGVAAYFALEDRDGQTFEQLADRPDLLRKRSTEVVIRAGLAKPEATWPWSELRTRAQSGQLSRAQGDALIKGLTQWMTLQHPKGYDKPLPWVSTLAEALSARQLVSEENLVAFLKAVHGRPSIEPLRRAREGQAHKIIVTCQSRNVWHRQLFGMVMLNELQSVSIVGVPAGEYDARVLDGAWTQFHSAAELGVGNLKPGKYVVRCEFEQAIFRESEIAGLPHNAPSSDWPAIAVGKGDATRRWKSIAEAELWVVAADQQVVQTVTDPALDPAATGWVPVKKIFIRKKGDDAIAVLIMNTKESLKLPVSFKVELRIAGMTYVPGRFFLASDEKSTTHSGDELTFDIRPVAPEITEAEVVFEPEPSFVETLTFVDRIWGKPIVAAVPLIRQDLGAALGAQNAP